MESSGTLNPQGDFNNINYNKIGIIKEYKTKVTVYTECYCKNKLNDRKIEHAFYRVILHNEIEKYKALLDVIIKLYHSSHQHDNTKFRNYYNKLLIHVLFLVVLDLYNMVIKVKK